MSEWTSHAMPQSMDPLTKVPRDSKYSRRLPKRAPSQPTLGIMTACMIMALVCTHCISSRSARRLVMMCGKASCTTVTLNPAVINPNMSAAVIHQ